MSDILKGRVVEHICLPSTDPDATVAFLKNFGAILLKKIPFGPQFIFFAGQIFEILQFDANKMLRPSVCHIAISATSPEEVDTIVNKIISLTINPRCTVSQNMQDEDITYTLLEIPGGIGIQIIYRKFPLRPVTE